MPNCEVCGGHIRIPLSNSRCGGCDKSYCREHRLTEQHDCESPEDDELPSQSSFWEDPIVKAFLTLLIPAAILGFFLKDIPRFLVIPEPILRMPWAVSAIAWGSVGALYYYYK